ncbi:MAG: transporter substrate-binding domain-containing protein [Bacillota bacterium]
MRKKYLFILIILVIVVLLIANTYVKNKYKVNLLKYFNYRQGLNDEEKGYLEKTDKIIYSSDRSSPPMRFMDPEDRQYKGGVIDYMNSLSLELGVEIDFKPLVWEEALYQLKTGKTDICDMFYSEKRAKDYLFSDPVYLLRAVILLKKENRSVNKLEELKSKKIAMQKKDYAVDFVKNKIGNNAEYILVNNIEEAIDLLLKDEVDAVIGDEPVVTYFSFEKNLNDELRIVNPPLYEKYIRLAVPKDKKVLLSAINKSIFSLRRKGILGGIQQKWFGLSASITDKGLNQYLPIIMVSILVLILIITLFLFWNYILNKRIQKRTKELEFSKNKLFQANKMAAIGQLAAGMAHEIRNPLGLIRTYIYLLESKIKVKNQDIENYFKEIKEAISKISRIIDNLLNTSYTSNSGEKEWINVNDYLQRLFSLHENLMENINWDITGDYNLEIYANKDRLEHILFNLISNAVDAIKNSGEINILYKIKEGDFYLEIEDSGEGISEDNLDDIFNPFFTTKEPGEGTGLGLYIVYNEIEKMNGEINVDSVEDEGTTFKIFLEVDVRRKANE